MGKQNKKESKFHHLIKSRESDSPREYLIECKPLTPEEEKQVEKEQKLLDTLYEGGNYICALEVMMETWDILAK